MIIKIENTPTHPFSSNEQWCVKTYMYRERDGGMNLWFKELERVSPDIVYLYDIKASLCKFSNDSGNDTGEDIVYTVKADLKI